jgi:ribA/ribD-fused uncharacterized protein
VSRLAELELYDPAEPPIGRFTGRYRFLGNFQVSPLVWEDMQYQGGEWAFNAGKTLDLAQRRWIASAPTPAAAKARGRHRCVILRPGWDSTVRYRVMDEVLCAKFTAHPGRVDALLRTGSRLLVEGNTWHDQHWGDCHCGRPECAPPGLNHLGLALMRLRAELRPA